MLFMIFSKAILAFSINGEWNAPETFNGIIPLILFFLQWLIILSIPIKSPEIIICLLELILAITTVSLKFFNNLLVSSLFKLIIAAIFPGLFDAQLSISCDLVLIIFRPSSKLIQFIDTRALYSPRLCPATAVG